MYLNQNFNEYFFGLPTEMYILFLLTQDNNL